MITDRDIDSLEPLMGRMKFGTAGLRFVKKK